MNHARRRFVVFMCLLSLCAGPESRAQEPSRPGLRVFGALPEWAKGAWSLRRQAEAAWALVGGNVIDVQTGSVLENATILIRGDLIERVGMEKVPEGAKTIDISGKFVVPGLFDLHAHVMPPSRRFAGVRPADETFRALIDAGVTTIRLLSFTSETALGWSARINDAALVGPTVITASGIFEQSPQRTSRGFGDPETARKWVRKEALLGTRWIKVYNKMDEPSLKAIVETAGSYGMKVCGHTVDVPPHRASALGMHCIEHMISLALSCRADGVEPQVFTDLGSRTAWEWDHVDDTKLAALMETFRTNRTAWVPTLVVTEQMIKGGKHDGVAFAGENVPQRLEKATRKAAAAAVALHRKGGLVGLGTDFPIDGVEPGVSVHREIELFVTYGGATPLEALQIATIGSARVLGFEALLGTVEADKIAHLVVLDGSPLEDITRTTAIHLVVHDGRVVESAARPDRTP